MKYSIIIVAYKAPEQLLKCLESLAKNPPQSSGYEAEIIIVDNSPAQIQEHVSNDLLYRLLRTYLRVQFVWDGINRGFAEGCNEGAKQANGKTLVFINPDTEVFPDWAERMAAHFTEGVGAVGPISNFVAGLQHLIYHMNPGSTWEKTAALAARGLNARGVDTKLLIGFFLMIPRKVWDKVGGMDPQFFLGCDDLDLSLRLRDAGYSLRIASDVFVYHEGHASFRAAGDVSMALNKQSEKKILAKLHERYGDAIPSSTELWGCEILPTYIPKRMTLSVCMIVRNEQENLSVLLPQLTMADEIVIVETSASSEAVWPLDNLILGVKPYIGYKSKTYHFPWSDDFAAARNFALSKCTGDYVLWLDADDRMPELSAKLIRAALDHPGPLTQSKQAYFALQLRDHTPEGRFAYAAQVRLFPRLPGIQWDGRAHEYRGLVASLMAAGLTRAFVDILIDHTGYVDPEVLAKKHARNLRLLQMEEDSPHSFYQIGNSLSGLKRFAEARESYLKCLNTKWELPLDSEFADQVRFRIAWDYYKEAGGAVPEMDAYLEKNSKPDALYFKGERAFIEEDLDTAEAAYSLYASYGPIMDFYGTDQELFTGLCRTRLEMIHMIKERPKEELPGLFASIREARTNQREVIHA